MYQCKETNKQCLNCNRNHSTLAMKCLKRKDIIREKKTQYNDRQKMTYANITQSTTAPKTPTYNIPQITKEEMLKIHICVAHAQVKNQEKPGTYAKELNKILKVNNLPDIIIPDEPEDTTDEPETGAIGQTTISKLETKIQKPSITRQSSTGNLNNKDDDETVKTLEACDLGIQFIQ